MSEVTQIIIDLFTTFLAVVCGLLIYNKMNLFYRLLLFQVVFYLTVDLISFAFKPNNAWIFNIAILVETALIMAAASVYFNSRLARNFLLFLFVLFFIIYMGDLIIISGFTNFLYHSAIFEGTILTSTFLVILYLEFNKGIGNPFNISLISVCLGLVIYFAATIPYLGIMFHFQNINPHLNKQLFQNIIVILASVRYFLLAFAFYRLKRGLIST